MVRTVLNEARSSPLKEILVTIWTFLCPRFLHDSSIALRLLGLSSWCAAGRLTFRVPFFPIRYDPSHYTWKSYCTPADTRICVSSRTGGQGPLSDRWTAAQHCAAWPRSSIDETLRSGQSLTPKRWNLNLASVFLSVPCGFID